MSVPSDWGMRPAGGQGTAQPERADPVDLLFGALRDDPRGGPDEGVAPEPGTVRAATDEVGPVLEALLLMADEPMATATLAEAVGVPVQTARAVLGELRRFYDDTHRGFELREVAGGWRYYTRAEHAEAIGAWVVAGQGQRLSPAALETLAVIAYTQPIARSRVSAVRGVNVDGVVRTLLARGLVAEVGHDEQTGAVLLGTTSYFLERLGLASLDDLPPIAPLLPDANELEQELAGLVREVPDLPGDDPAGT